MIPFHKWLIRQRIYCELCPVMDLRPAVAVVQSMEQNPREIVVCKFHAGKSMEQNQETNQ